MSAEPRWVHTELAGRHLPDQQRAAFHVDQVAPQNRTWLVGGRHPSADHHGRRRERHGGSEPGPAPHAVVQHLIGRDPDHHHQHRGSAAAQPYRRRWFTAPTPGANCQLGQCGEFTSS